MKERKFLTTRECADAIGMTTQFIRGEILDGRLTARASKPPGRQRTTFRVHVDDFAVYRDRHWPKSA